MSTLHICQKINHIQASKKLPYRGPETLPRFQPENLEQNKTKFDRVNELVAKKGFTSSQSIFNAECLSWFLLIRISSYKKLVSKQVDVTK
ncbi:hypothetical protein Fmac_017251 [Flemingia macrophylla]|uniref:Uncharacterized protein n=1 Tax=Flemingia macrophylla TaxID=520843 RepID=A0ABD1M1L2_9FABA